MKTLLLSYLLFVSPCLVLNAQVTRENYTPLASTGTIPTDFITPSSQKYVEVKKQIDKNAGRRDRKAKEQFYLSNSFEVDKLLLSGQVSFNDPITIYLNKVAGELLKNEPELKSKIRIYTVKSAAVNAFATDGGIILVNLGLVSQMNNEAEIAFVLGHEISHYVKKHSMDMYEVSNSISKGNGVYKDFSRSDRLVAKSNYSKEIETEADELGLERYLKSNYSLGVINEVFDVMQYSYLPFDELPFDKSFLETANLVFPKDYFLKDIKPISGDVDDETSKLREELSTHPSVPERRDNMLSRTKGKSNDGRLKYIVSEAEFKKVRDISRFEVSRIHLLNLDYEAAIYNSYLLLKQYPDNLFLKKNIAKSLLALTQYNNAEEFSEAHVNYKKMEGESQQVNYLMGKLSDHKQELNAVALSYAWRLKIAYPADSEITKICSKLAYELVVNAEYKLDRFSTESRKQVVDSIKEEVKVIDAEPAEAVSKYDRIKKKKVKQEADDDRKENEYYKYAFVEFMQDDDFKKLMREKERMIKYKDDYNSLEAKAERRKESRRNYRKGYALGIDRVAVVDPFYLSINFRKQEGYEYLQSEQGQIKMNDKVTKSAAMNHLDYTIVDKHDLTGADVAKFNDLTSFNEWIGERLSHKDDVPFSGFEKDRIAQLEQQYGTKYFLWVGAISTKDYAYKSPVGLILYAIFIPPILPYYISKLLSERNNTYYYSVLYNIETNKMLMAEYYPINEKAHDSVLNAYLYSTFEQIKHKRK